MLRLEKIRKTHDISVTLRKKAPFFSTTFCLALLWALGIHLFGLLIFHVAPFRITYSDSIFPPVSVASDLGKIWQGNALAYLDEDIVVPPYLLLPLSLDFSTPSIPELPQPKKSEYYSANFYKNPFLSVELDSLVHENPKFDLPMDQLMKIHVSGPLADFAWKYESIDFSVYEIKKGEYAIAYDIKVDESGHVFWWQPHQKMPQPLISWGDAILKGIFFEIPVINTSFAGKVEIFLRVSHKEKI